MDFLKKNDKIAIVSTARKISEAEILSAIKKLEEWGLNVVTGKNIFREYHQFAGTDDERREDLQNALVDSTVKAILCSRGGYGTIRIVEKLDFSEFLKKPKWIVGYSDITTLHSLVNNKFNLPSIHAAMGFNFPPDGSDNMSTGSLKDALYGHLDGYSCEINSFNKPGETEGMLVGGNLSILYSLQGTKFDIETKNKILFIEDIDEYLYHIDRMMISLKLAGKFDKLAGLIIGGMTDMKDNPVPFGKNAYEIISECISEYDYPVIFNFSAGHIEQNLALYFGKNTRMIVSEKKSVINFK